MLFKIPFTRSIRWSQPRQRWDAGSAFTEIDLTAKDGVPVSAWFGKSSLKEHSKGTVILANGFMSHSRQCGCEEWAWLFMNSGYDIVAADFRNHGNSGTKGIPSFGLPESWDMESCLDFASEKCHPPYMLFGSSMAGMAAQLLAQRDSRVSAVAMCITPSSSIQAISAHPISKVPGLGEIGKALWSLMLQSSYGTDIMAESDLLRGDMHPRHEPDILYVSGGRDIYGELSTRNLFKRWYETTPEYDGEVILDSCDIPCTGGTKKYYFLFPEGGHGDGLPWDGIRRLIIDFFNKASAKRR
jgi:pimeloyl-ACP methyl ester carboxylesterase